MRPARLKRFIVKWRPPIVRLIGTRNVYLIVLCLSFALYNSIKLFEQRHRMVYDTNYDRDRKLPLITICIKINSSLYDCSKITDNEVDIRLNTSQKCKKLKDLFSFVEDRRTEKISIQQILDRFSLIGLNDDLVRINGVNTSSNSNPIVYIYRLSYLNYNHVCVQYRCKECKRKKIQVVQITNTYRIPYALFIHEEKYPIQFGNYLVEQSCNIFKKCAGSFIFIEKYEFNLLKSPYESHCIDYKTDFKTMFDGHQNKPTNSKEGCKNICFKSQYRTSFFFYSYNDSETIRYKSNFENDTEDMMLRDIVKRCLKLCNQSDCYSSRYFLRSRTFYGDDRNELHFELEPSFISIDARPYIGKFELYLNIVGCISLVLGIDVLLLIAISFRFLKRKIIRNYFINDDSVNKLIFIIKWSLMCLLFSLSVQQSIETADDYLTNVTKLHYKIRYPTEFESFDLHVCLPLSRMIVNSPYLDSNESRMLHWPTDEELKNESKWVENYLKNKTLADVVRDTFNLTYAIKDVHFDFGLKIKNVSLSDDLSKSLFRSQLYHHSFHIAYKCFTIRLEMDANDYENFFVSVHLVVVTRVEMPIFYATPIDRRLSYDDSILYDRREIVKRTISRKTECAHYDQTPCKSRWNCLDQCVFDFVLKKYEQVYLSPFHLEEFKTFANYTVHPKYDLDYKVNRCNSSHALRDCNQTIYDVEKTHFHSMNDTRTRVLQVVFRNIFATEVELGRTQDYWLNLITLYSVLLGINAPMIMQMTFTLFALRFDLRKIRTRSKLLFKVLFFLLFICTINLIVQSTFKSELGTSLFLQNIPLIRNFPTINICFDYRLPNSMTNFTGFDLMNATSDINYDKVFDYFLVIDNNDETKISSPFKRHSGILDLKDPFFILNKKCLSIAYDFTWIQSHVTNFKYPLQLRFNPNLNYTYYYYCSNLNGNLTLSQFNRLNIEQPYEVFFDMVDYGSFDIFEELRNPWLYFKKIKFHDLEQFLPLLSDDFVNKTSNSTRWIPLHKDYFKFVIDDRSFESYYKEQFKGERENKFASQNFKYRFNKERIFSVSYHHVRNTSAGKIWFQKRKYSIQYSCQILISSFFFH